MTISIWNTVAISLWYSAAAAIIRFVYVRNSHRNGVQAVVKRNAFIYQTIFLVEFLGGFNLYSFYMMQEGKSGVERLPFLVYQTCLDSTANYTHQNLQFTKKLSFHIILIQVACGCIIKFAYMGKFR